MKNNVLGFITFWLCRNVQTTCNENIEKNHSMMTSLDGKTVEPCGVQEHE